MSSGYIVDQLRAAHRGTDQFLDYRTIINDFAERLIVVTKPISAGAITLECIDFVPAHIPNDVKTVEERENSLNRIKKRKFGGVNGVFRNEQATNNLVAHGLNTVATKGFMGPPSTILNPKQTTSSGISDSSVAMSALSDIQTKSSAVPRTITPLPSRMLIPPFLG